MFVQLKKVGCPCNQAELKYHPSEKTNNMSRATYTHGQKITPVQASKLIGRSMIKQLSSSGAMQKKKVLRKRRPMLAGMVMSCGSPNRNQHQPKPHPFWPTICKEAMLKCSTSQHALAIAPPQWLCPACEPPLLPALVVPPAAVGLEQCSWSSSTKPIAAPPRTKPRTRRQASNSALFPLP